MSAHGLRIVCMDSEYHALKFESDQKLALSRKSHRHPNHARIELTAHEVTTAGEVALICCGAFLEPVGLDQ